MPTNRFLSVITLLLLLAPGAPAEKRKVLFYRNPMTPSITSPMPMKDPMGMDYIPVYDEGTSTVPEHGPITVTPEQEQAIGMTVVPVEKRALSNTIRASARVAYDPGLYTAILEYHEAAKAETAGRRANADAELRAENTATVQAARLHLRQLGLSEDQIRQISAGSDPSNLLLGGEGGSVWIYADLYEYEAAQVRPGQRAEITTEAYSGRRFVGFVRSVDTVVNSETRTIRARIELPDPDGLLKPDMYAEVQIRTGLGSAIAVPKAAVMDTGARRLVFVQEQAGRFVPREVTIGREADDYLEVLNGLKEGDFVASGAAFLLDSESRLKAPPASAEHP